ncbi:MAG: hypothetical protein ACOCVH_02650 [Verrucomicrobiota bacterium]
MRMIAGMIVLILALIAAHGAKAAGSVKFEEGPVAKKKGDGALVGFKLSGPTDVEVSVLNSKGEIVRHLAAGVLGNSEGSEQENPPPAPLRPGLTQVLEWDGKDDKGKPAQGGPFSFRVRAGIQPEFDGFPVHDPHGSGAVIGVVTAPDNQIYVFHKHSTANGNMGNFDIKVYDHDGHSVRNLKPFPADIPQERVEGTRAFSDEDGRLVPRIYNWEQLSFYDDLKHDRGRSITDSPMPAVDSKGNVYWIAGEARTRGPALMSLDADGGVSRPADEFIGPRILPDMNGLTMSTHYGRKGERPSLAASGDDKYIYVTSLGVNKKFEHYAALKGIKNPVAPVVFRFDAKTLSDGEVFLGKIDQTGTEGELLTMPRALAVANGKVYVADIRANRVVVYNEKDGSYAGQISVKNPDTVAVDPESGAVYVCVSGNPATLIKFDGYENGNELYRGKVPKGGRARIGAMTASEDGIRLWLPKMHYGPNFTCVEDTGEGFKILGDPRPDGQRANGPRDLSYDRIREELYVKTSGERWHRICGKTHEIKKTFSFGAPFEMGAYATQLLVRDDGNIVTLSYSPKRAMRLWTRDIKPLNWPGHDSNQGTTWGGIMTFSQNYMALHEDEIYFIPPGHYKQEGKDWRFSSLNVMGYDRKERRTAIWQLTRGSIPRVDAKGNIYIASMMREPGRIVPEFFDDKLKPIPDKLTPGVGWSSGRPSSGYWYSYMYGGIAKFPPEGGSIWHKEGEIPSSVVGEIPREITEAPKIKIDYHYYYNTREKGYLQNAEWFRYGFAPYSETYPVGTPTCMCEGAGFDVDAWGRVFYPNLGQYRVEMIDNNNNYIGNFGHYGNADSMGGGKMVETAHKYESTERAHPDIPLAWPTYVAVSDTHAYVNDTLSRRVVAARLNAELTETVAVP